MSYPGIPGTGSSGYYGHDPPGSSPYGIQKPPPHPMQNGSHPQYQTPSSNSSQFGQHPDAQILYNQRSVSIPSTFNGVQSSLSVQPQLPHPQFINPAQLFQQPQPSYQPAPQTSFDRQAASSASNTSTRMAPFSPPA